MILLKPDWAPTELLVPKRHGTPKGPLSPFWKANSYLQSWQSFSDICQRTLTRRLQLQPMYSRPHVKYQHVCSMCTHVSCYILSTQGQYMDGKVHKMQNVLSVLVEQSLLNSDWICQNVKDHSSNLTMQCEMDQVSFNSFSSIFCFLDL